MKNTRNIINYWIVFNSNDDSIENLTKLKQDIDEVFTNEKNNLKNELNKLESSEKIAIKQKIEESNNYKTLKQIKSNIQQKLKEQEKLKKDVEELENTIKNIKTKKSKLSELDDKYKKNKNVVLEAIKVDATQIEFANQELKNDPDVVKEAH
ncbi:DUF4116 domain-containing protein [Mycoplasmopsis cynos]|uniref:DUF4116 domain-containing protein n=1 Tax=Mycoplasmopsis cynos TaxID=171284 RepID=UPI0024C58831|nr:DUF4116 domain-containing protein [Mycoplasmopsis cynos]WAM02932.1 DUF4116 domain-containing protein [Mycoplasmopsis cynos]